MSAISLLPVAEMAATVHAGANPWKALAMLRAYFDESGTHIGSPVTAIAGFAATAEVWTAIETEWSKVLADFKDKGVEAFHMTDCLAATGQFSRLDAFWRNYLVNSLAAILERSDIQAIWAGVNTEDWDDLTTPEFREQFPKPYDLCFDEVVRQLYRWSRHGADGTPVALVFGEQTEYQTRNELALQAWRRHPEFCRFIGSVTYSSPKLLIPLQAADMLAYEINKEWEKVEFQELTWQNVGLRSVLERITKIHGLHGGGLFGDQAIRTAVARFHIKSGT